MNPGAINAPFSLLPNIALRLVPKLPDPRKTAYKLGEVFRFVRLVTDSARNPYSWAEVAVVFENIFWIDVPESKIRQYMKEAFL